MCLEIVGHMDVRRRGGAGMNDEDRSKYLFSHPI